MVRIGADRIQGLMQRLGMEEGVPIEHNMVTKSIERAQKRMEGRHFDVRKSLLEYDDVMDQQRKAVYELRTKILKGEGISELVLDVLDSTLEMLLNTYANPEVRVDDWSMESLARELKENFKIEIAPEDLPLDRHSLEEMLWTKVREALDAKVGELDHIAEKYNEKFAEDADFEPKTAQGVFNDLARNTYLRELDKRYRDHLQAMRSLRASVRLHGYAQRDPKQIYKTEGYDLFQSMRADVATNVSKYIMRFVVKKEESVQAAQMPRGTSAPRRVTMSGGQAAAAAPKAEERRELPKIGRNDPCWCGSGKKYKKCHMRADQAAAASAAGSAAEPVAVPAAKAPAAKPAAKAPAPAPAAGGNGKVEIPADIAAAVADAKADKGDKKDQGISLI